MSLLQEAEFASMTGSWVNWVNSVHDLKLEMLKIPAEDPDLLPEGLERSTDGVDAGSLSGISQ